GSVFAMLREQEGIMPDAIAAHNSGIYAALFAAGGLSFTDMVYILQKYNGFYQELLNHVNAKAFRVTGLEEKVVAALCAQVPADAVATIALYESETEFVV